MADTLLKYTDADPSLTKAQRELDVALHTSSVPRLYSTLTGEMPWNGHKCSLRERNFTGLAALAHTLQYLNSSPEDLRERIDAFIHTMETMLGPTCTFTKQPRIDWRQQ